MTPEQIAAGLSEAQRSMLTRPPGRYSDCLADVGHLIDLGLWGTGPLQLGLAVRAILEKQNAPD